MSYAAGLGSPRGLLFEDSDSEDNLSVNEQFRSLSEQVTQLKEQVNRIDATSHEALSKAITDLKTLKTELSDWETDQHDNELDSIKVTLKSAIDSYKVANPGAKFESLSERNCTIL